MGRTGTSHALVGNVPVLPFLPCQTCFSLGFFLPCQTSSRRQLTGRGLAGEKEKDDFVDSRSSHFLDSPQAFHDKYSVI